MFSNSDLPGEGTVNIFMAGDDEPYMDDIPTKWIGVHGHDEGQALIVGDNHGEVARFPFVESDQESDHMWRFTGPDEDFYIVVNPEAET